MFRPLQAPTGGPASREGNHPRVADLVVVEGQVLRPSRAAGGCDAGRPGRRAEGRQPGPVLNVRRTRSEARCSERSCYLGSSAARTARTVRHCAALFGTVWHCSTLFGTVWHCAARCGAFCTARRGAALCCAAPYGAAPRDTVRAVKSFLTITRRASQELEPAHFFVRVDSHEKFVANENGNLTSAPNLCPTDVTRPL